MSWKLRRADSAHCKFMSRCKFMLSRVVWAPSAACQSFIYPLFVKFFSISSAAVVDFIFLACHFQPYQVSTLIRRVSSSILPERACELLLASPLSLDISAALPATQLTLLFISRLSQGKVDIVISVFPQPLIFNTFCKTVLLWIFLVSLYCLHPLFYFFKYLLYVYVCAVCIYVCVSCVCVCVIP